MFRRRLLALLSALLIAPLVTAQEQSPFLVTAMGTYQDESVLQERIGPDGAQALANYVDAVVHALGDHVVGLPRARGANVAVVMAVKPGQQSRAWLVHLDGAVTAELEATLVQRALSVPPLAVDGGPIAVYIVADLWGGGAPVVSETDPYPVPMEWLEAIRQVGGGRLPEAALEVLWP
jgi:hypothetical protein